MRLVIGMPTIGPNAVTHNHVGYGLCRLIGAAMTLVLFASACDGQSIAQPTLPSRVSHAVQHGDLQDRPENAQAGSLQTRSSVRSGYRGLIVDSATVTKRSIAQWKAEGWNAIGVNISETDDLARCAAAALLISESELDTEYFFEIARSPQLADAHPAWMSSLQGHDEWRRLFPEFPVLAGNELAKTYPWVPICYRESFDAHLKRLTGVLQRLPRPERVWLHDLQAAPSACGCGHPLCRWTGDYGPIHTATPLGDSAAADFVAALEKTFGQTAFVPIWATECEEDDEHGACGGVGCFEGICWKAWTRQLELIANQCPTIGVSGFYKAHQRDLPRYGATAGWIPVCVSAFESVPKKKGAAGVEPQRLIAVLQGWDVTAEERAAQESMAKRANCLGVLMVSVPIDQSWSPTKYSVAEKK